MGLALGQIGYFQVVNLLRNKVPFHLVTLDVDWPEPLPVSLSKLFAAAVPTDLNQLLPHLQCSNIKQSDPLILLCQNGSKSKEGHEILQGHGYLNVYSVRGGIEALLSEAEEG